MRLIDADALVGAIRHDADQTPDYNWGYGLNHAVVIVRSQPTVDAVPVVRCNECKHGSLYCTEDVCGETLIECNRPDIGDVIEIHGWTWFCADGERKDVVNE